MITKTKIALAAVLMVASASTALADTAKHRVHYRAPGAVAAAQAAPFTQFEQRWFDSRSRICCP
jgi:hypothetical protein